MAEASGARAVVVTGDVTTDWSLTRVPSPRDPHAPGARATTNVSSDPGGAALLGRLIETIAADLAKDGDNPIAVHAAAPPDQPAPGDGRGSHSFAIWSRFPRDASSKGGPTVWRISEALGIDEAADATRPALEPDPDAADLVVIDAGLGFGHDAATWPRALTAKGASPWVVLKMTRPVGEGELWKHVSTRHADRLVAVVRVNDLRLTEAQISRELSWERTAQDLVWELTYNPEVKALSRCAHLVVSFGTSGALLLSDPGEGPRRARLFFDPPVMEEEWAEQHPGGMAGYTICLTAAVAREILLDPAGPNLGRGIRSGLDAMRNLHLEGYDAGGPSGPRLRFPAERVAGAIAEGPKRFAEVLVREPGESPAPGQLQWTILEEVCTEGLEQVARRIVVGGSGDIVRKVPVAKFGKLLTVHRQEIEGYRSIRSLIGQYARQARPQRPLSIAVFGRPGSGKSFGIKQIALALLPGRIASLTFNLSQFHEPAQLLDAFHQVRDESLKGKLPLVFWDEFDAKLGDQQLGWLKHFLAPMQDGEFQQGQVTHHIGAAIFVFAGGTKERMEDFAAQQTDAFKNGKGRDFVSRLKGYVDVLGPNPAGGPGDDPHYVIRRAILLRSMLESHSGLLRERDGTNELQIDSGVLRAFLRVREYVHGARSLESVIAMSLLDGKSRFERSCLPSAEQLEIHVDARDFLDVVRSLVVEGKMLHELAEAAHVEYCAVMLGDGHTWRKPGDEYLKRHEALEAFAGHPRDPSRTSENLVPYEELPRDVREQNEDFARDIPNKIAAVGYEIVRGRGDGSSDAIPEEVVELLAEQEHDRWMLLKARQLWSWGAERDDKRLRHPAMLPWREMTKKERVERYGAEAAARSGSKALPESEKSKDRALISAVAKILAQNGYRVEKRAAVG